MTGAGRAARRDRRRLDTEVLVIGSGAGGAPTAALLAEAGFDVTVVEEGAWVEQGATVPFSLDQMGRQHRSGGVLVALGSPSIAYTEGCCAGGGTEINSALYRRTPPELFERWRREHAIADLDPDEMSAIAAEIEAELGIDVGAGGRIQASEAMRRGAAALGWRVAESPRWIRPDPQQDPPGGHRAGERMTMTATYLPRAMRAGARIVTGCRVDRVLHDRGRAHAAVVRSASGDGLAEIRFRYVIVCGGAIQTPALLQRSRVDGPIGRSLALHPTVKLAARFDDDVNPGHEVPAHQVREFAPDLTFGGSASHPGMVALALLDHWRRFGPAVAEWPRIAVYYAAITSEGRGRVRSLPGVRDPVVTYHLTRRDREMLRSGLGRLALVMLAAGAREIFPSVRNAPIVRDRRDIAQLLAAFRASAASVMTVHLSSTVPIGERPERCPADSFGRVRGLANVAVNDASLLPDAPGVNPQGTVMAMAIRNARRFIASERPRG